MTDTRKISVAIPTWQREDILYSSFETALEDHRISEIIIVDDCSDLELYKRVADYCKKYSKIKLIRNIVNIDCYQNKMRAISFINNEFGILFDSDNRFAKQYIDKIFEQEWLPNRILAPVFAAPMFDYREFADLVVTKNNVAEYMDKPMFSTALNTANYFVNRDFYVQAHEVDVDPVTADSIFMAYKWLSNGGEIHFVKGLEYFHRVHPGSHYQNNVSRTPNGFLELIESKLKSLR